MNNGSREALCEGGHYFRVAGILHWNPWGSPDFEATEEVRCECGAPSRLLSKDEQTHRLRTGIRCYNVGG